MLKIEDLTIAFPHQANPAVQQVYLAVAPGEIVGVVGESGSGKSLTSLSAIGLLPSAAQASGAVYITRKNGDVVNMIEADEEAKRQVRAHEIGMIFQEPMTSLNPVIRVEKQVLEALEMGGDDSSEDPIKAVVQLFRDVQLPDPENIGRKYPHQLSGGQKQRVMIALALASNPRLLIADEPTTALDVTVQKSILEILRSLVQQRDLSVLFISHDLGVIAELCDRVYVMQQGRIVESGETKNVLTSPQHTYTKGLMACRPSLKHKVHRLPTIERFMSGLDHVHSTDNAHSEKQKASTNQLLSVANIQVSYPKPSNLFWKRAEIPVVHSVSMSIDKAQIHGIVGESGCGKTTVGKAVVGLLPYSGGSITFGEREVRDFLRTNAREYQSKVQLIFQDPYGSLNPRLTIGETLYEVARVHGIDDKTRDVAIKNILELTGMPLSSLSKYPFQFSGGQRQRICIARSLIVQPELLICDESVSALDVSVQAQVLNVLKDLRDELQVSMLFITHDLSVVRFMCDTVSVMHKGRIVESGDVHAILDSPNQQYTKTLIDAVPTIDFERT